MSDTDQYVGRFAPSPTGPLHFGSLLAATASYLQARVHDGRWQVRMEDIDPPRQQPGAVEQILNALQVYGFEWDGPVIYQSRSRESHEAHVNDLLRRKLAYPCKCSRRDLADAPRGPMGLIYPGTCRDGCNSTNVAIRLKTNDLPIHLDDGLQGSLTQRLESESGDFLIKRRDGLIAYHLAVVVDDHLQGVNEVVRGIDLLDSSPRQIHLQQLLGFATPAYLHIPVAINADGQKLSKLTGANGIPLDDPGPVLTAALSALGQAVKPDLAHSTPQDIWNWAIEHWRLEPLQGVTSISII